MLKLNMAKQRGWVLLENIKTPFLFTPQGVSLTNFELVPVVRDNEQLYGADEVLARAEEKKANLGQVHAEYILERRSEIPDEWRHFCILFPGTRWMTALEVRSPSLYFDDHHWKLHFAVLEGPWAQAMRVARLRA